MTIQYKGEKYSNMREYNDVIGKLWELIKTYEVSDSDTLKKNLQGMIEALFWVVNEDIEPELLVKIENII